MMRVGTLPRRNPGTLTCDAILLYACSMESFRSSKGISTVSFTRVSDRFSTVLFTLDSYSS